MALSTSAFQPHSPLSLSPMNTAYNKDAHLASASWSVWSPTPKDNARTPLTPPLSSTFQSRRPTSPSANVAYSTSQNMNARVALPPISYLDRQLSAMPPLTPPDDVGVNAPASSTSARLPPLLSQHYQPPSQPQPPTAYETDPFVCSPKHFYQETALPEHAYKLSEPPQPPAHAPQPTPPPPQSVCVWDSSPHMIDWLDFTRNRSAHFIAEKTCEMICYLWFASSPVAKSASIPRSSGSPGGRIVNGTSNGLGSNGDSMNAYPSPNHSPSSPSSSTHISSLPPHPKPSSPTRSQPSSLQLVATRAFVNFMQKLLETTQVSQSVIVLSLHYIYRLKERNRFTPAQGGSEFRIAVAGLMMANKFLDDNTYTNKTWSEVSGIELEEINRMEREFLLGVDFNLYVDKPTYESWLNLLKGLVYAKERDSMSGSRAESHRRHGRDARKVSASSRAKALEYHHRHAYAQPSQDPSSRPQVQVAHHHYQERSEVPYQDSEPQQPQQHQPESPNHYQAYPTATRLPPLSRVVPTAYPRARSTSPTSVSYYGSGQRSASATMGANSDMRMDTHSPSSASIYTTNAYSQGQYSASTSGYASTSAQTPPHLRVNAAQASTQSNKRTAEAAFSPTSASFKAHLPSKRPVSMVLQIPDSSFGTGMSSRDSAQPHSYSPLESLSSFARMSLATSAENSPEKKQHQHQSQLHHQQVQQLQAKQAPLVPSTLVAPYSYSLDSQRRSSQPQELYFYTLASSPMEATVRSGSRRERRQTEEGADVEMPTDGEDMEMMGEEEEDREEEMMHGQRLRTRKGKLMKWYRGAEDQQAGGYAYDYSKSHSNLRQQQQQGYSYPAVHGTSSTAPQANGVDNSSRRASTSSTAASGSMLAPLGYPAPRPYVGFVQSASTSPSGIYVRDVPYVGTAYPAPHQSQYRQSNPPQRTDSWYPNSLSYHPSPVHAKAECYRQPQAYWSAPTNVTPPPASSTVTSLPQPHDDVWLRPPAVVASAHRRDEEEQSSDIGSDDYMDSEDRSRSSAAVNGASTSYYSSAADSVTHASAKANTIPTAPFANAGPAGVHVPFGSTSYIQHPSHAGYGYEYSPDQSAAGYRSQPQQQYKPQQPQVKASYQTQIAYPQHTQQQPHPSHTRYGEDWVRGTREY